VAGKLLDYALAYAKGGFSVLPLHSPADGACSCRRPGCDSPAKHPRLAHGLTDATLDEPTIRRWWAQWPEANVGLAIPDGYVVVDVDIPEASVALNGHDMPTTATAKTGRGWQFLFRTSTPVRPKVGVLEHVDLRGPGSYVVAPPSRHMSGADYVWLLAPREGIADAPAWVLEAGARAPVALADDGAPIPPGERNATFTRMAGAMRHQGMTATEIESGLLAVNGRTGASPLPVDEVASIARSVARYAPGERGPVVVLSAQQREALGRQTRTLFRSGREVVDEVPASWRYVVRPWIARGMVTELDGKPKAAGKTTFLLHLVRAVLDGAPFLGEPTERTPVVYLTEQSRSSLAPTLRTLGLDRDELAILSWPDAAGTSWPSIVAAALEEVDERGAGLLIVDTVGQFAGIRGDGENDAGAALEAMSPLQAAVAERDLGIVVSRHDRKSGGDVAESGRGSNAWTGAVDCVMALRRQLNPARPTIREIEAISRRGDVPAEPVVIELAEGRYTVLGSTGAVAFDEAQTKLADYLTGQPEPRSERDILGDLESERLTRSTLQRARDALMASGALERVGAGKAGDPYRYQVASLPNGSGQTLPPVSGVPSLSALHVGVGQTDIGPHRPPQSDPAAAGFARYLDESKGGMWAALDAVRDGPAS